MSSNYFNSSLWTDYDKFLHLNGCSSLQSIYSNQDLKTENHPVSGRQVTSRLKDHKQSGLGVSKLSYQIGNCQTCTLVFRVV